MSKPVILSAVRTPIGNFGGALKDVSAVALAEIAITEALKRADLRPEQVDEVIMGNVLQAGIGQNPARQCAIAAGIPVERPAMTVNQACASGLRAVALAADAVRLDRAEVIAAGGTENMSQAPYLLTDARWGYRMGNGELVDSLMRDGLWCVLSDYHMGVTAENLVEKYGITRSEQDECATESQRKCAAATEKLSAELAPVEVPQRKGPPIAFEADEFPRPNTTVETLSKLRPAFKDDGTVTAGNASGINDGAAAVIVASEAKAQALGVSPLAKIVDCAVTGVAPDIMGIGPAFATRNVLERTGLSFDDLDLIELNEAFAAQVIAVNKELGWDSAKVNVNGGAIALGHPIGASGARILVTLLHEMERRQARRGLATLCVGGGMGIAMAVER